MGGAALRTVAALGAALPLHAAGQGEERGAERAFARFAVACGGEDGSAAGLDAAFARAGLSARSRVADYRYVERDGGRTTAGWHVGPGSWSCFLGVETPVPAELCATAGARLGRHAERLGDGVCYIDTGDGSYMIVADTCSDRPGRPCLWLQSFRRGEMD